MLYYVNTKILLLMNVKTLKLTGKQIPEVLQQIPDPPKQLYVCGNLNELLDSLCLAVVGSRKVTPYGKAVTNSLVGAMARQGIVIVSGLALGVDGLAHQAALQVHAKTIAVLPCGLDRIYPASHYQLARQIIEQGGALVSEYPEGTEPFPINFIGRNRLVSGLSSGVLITEAGERSGTLHTANFALEQGRTVMAVPGNITNPLSVGTNSLIKTGAAAITQPEDILAALDLELVEKETQEIVADNSNELAVLELLKDGVTDSAELQQRSQLKPSVFSQTLTMLEITGRIKALGAGHWTIR